jgi:NHLM bacteriocin system ABC transporter ATP-binding protein
VWFVEQGAVVLHAMAVKNGIPHGSRLDLIHVGAGGIFLGFGQDAPSGRALVAAAVEGVRLVRAPRAALGPAFSSRQSGRRIRDLLEAWIEKLHGVVQGRGARPSSAHDAESNFAAMMAHVAELSRRAWAHGEQLADQQAAASAARVRNVSSASQAIIAGACRRLVSTALPPHQARRLKLGAAAVAPTTPQDSLFEACRLVAEALGMDLKPPPPAIGGGDLRAILRASHLRSRKVALREGWWRRDHGPLLAFNSDNQPVALLREGGRYVAFGISGEAQTVDATFAGALGPFGRMLYAPLPDTRLRVRDVFRIATRGCRGDLVTVIAMGALATLMGMIPPVATGILFNSIIPGAQRSQLQQMMVLLIVCAISSAGFGLVRGLTLMRMQQRMGTALQAAVWDRVIRLPPRFFQKYSAGDLATRTMAIGAIQTTLSGTALTTILNGVFALANLGMMFVYSPTLAVHALVLVAIATGVAVASAYFDLRPQGVLLSLQSKTSGLVLQLLSSINKLRVAGAEARAFAEWADLFAEQRRIQLTVRRISNWFGAFSAAFPILAEGLLFWAALPLLGTDRGGLRTGDFLAFGGAFTACFSGLLGTAVTLMGVLEVIPLYQQARPILETQPEAEDGLADPGGLTGSIVVQNASFRYQDEGPLIVRDFSLEVRPGEFVALVGPSGSGKSTILRLLLGFERLHAGAIRYDGQELAALDVQAVRRQMGVVLQNGSLIPGDLFSNITGAHSCTVDEAWAAAEMAGIADDIKNMPMQMHTVIGDGASTLSGGQRQRVMIARAIVNRPKILLFDEATSALDNRTQALVCASLAQMNATRIVVAHRLSTIIQADRIVVIDQGQIVESGRFDELLRAGGLFAELARRQMV